jgi:hypothetical protein
MLMSDLDFLSLRAGKINDKDFFRPPLWSNGQFLATERKYAIPTRYELNL